MTTEKSDGSVYEVITQIDPITGETIIPIPPEVLQRLNWKEGDEITFDRDTQGRIVISKLPGK